MPRLGTVGGRQYLLEADGFAPGSSSVWGMRPQTADRTSTGPASRILRDRSEVVFAAAREEGGKALRQAGRYCPVGLGETGHGYGRVLAFELEICV